MAVGSHQLRLSACGAAVGATALGSQTRLAADCRGSAIQTKLSDFHAEKNGSSLSPSSKTFLVAGTQTFTYQFLLYGSLLLSRIASRYQNFAWSENVADFSVAVNSDYTAGTSSNAKETDLGQLTALFNDGFNYTANQSQTASIAIGEPF